MLDQSVGCACLHRCVKLFLRVVCLNSVLCVQSVFMSVSYSWLDECGFTVFVLCSLWFLLDVFLGVPGCSCGENGFMWSTCRLCAA